MRSIALALSLVFIFLVPWEGAFRLPGGGTIAKVVGIAVGAFWMATVLVTGRIRKLGPFQIMMVIFVLWNAFSVFWSENPNRSLAHAQTWGQMLLLVLILWDLYTTRSALLAGLQAYILGAYVAVGSAINNYFNGQVYYTNNQRFSAGETNPDGFGFIMALGIPLAWDLAGSINASGIGRVLRVINYIYIPAALLGIALSGTRTALLASVVGMAFGLASLTRLRLAARIAIFALLASIILFLLPYVQTLESFQRLGTTGTELTSGDLNNRTNNWSEGFASFLEHPLLGVGSNMYRSINSLAKTAEGKVSHNSYLSVLVELGLIGFVIFAIILGIAFTQAWHQPKWQSWFWLTVLTVWSLGAFTLTWEARKSTWLFLSFVVVSGAITNRKKALAVYPVTRLATERNQTATTQKARLVTD
jgi:O-antigen ligase